MSQTIAMKRSVRVCGCLLWASVVGALAIGGCSGNGGGGAGGGSGSHPTGQSCTQATQCYPGLDAGSLHGTVTCLTQSLTNGYCTHTCSADSDCCAVPGECSGYPEICAPFESTGQSYCFLSCTAAAIATTDAGTTDANAYCQRYANPSFSCRSTGGGKNNQLFCGP